MLQLYQSCGPSAETAHVCSISEFLLAQPVLSYAVLDAGRRRLVKAQEYTAELAWSCTTGVFWLFSMLLTLCFVLLINVENIFHAPGSRLLQIIYRIVCVVLGFARSVTLLHLT